MDALLTMQWGFMNRGHQPISEIDRMDYGEAIVLDSILYEQVKAELQAGR
jgi:hypothetical protein